MQPERHDIERTIADAPLQPIHIRVLAISLMVSLVDGFDNQALAFTAPAMAAAWGLSVADFSAAFSAGLIGMMAGSLVFGELAGRIGRRPVMVWATAMFGAITLLTPFVDSTGELIVLRFAAGLGLGGLPSVVASLVTEYTPLRWRQTFGNWAFIGIPTGGFVGGLLASVLVPQFGWQSVYWVGGGLTLVVALVALAALPEAPTFLLRRPDGQAAARRVMARIAPHRPPSPDAVLAAGGGQQVKTSIATAFREGRTRMTLLFWLAEVILLMGYYFLVNWVPSLLIHSGLSMQMAALGSAVLNTGGILFGLGLGRLSDRIGARRVVSAVFVLGAVSLGLATQAGSSVPLLMVAIFLAGGGWIAGQAAIVVLVAGSYPAEVRSIVVGWTLTVGRIGAIVSPLVVSVPLNAGWTAPQILMLPIIPALVGAVAVAFARRQARPGPQDEARTVPHGAA